MTASLRARRRAIVPLATLADVDALRAAEARRALCAGWGDFLNDLAWDHFATLTYATPAPSARIRRDFEAGFIRRVAFRSLGPVPWFYAMERGDAGGRLHLHALLAGTAHVPARELQAAWKCGDAQIESYDPRRGAAWYVAKALPSDTSGDTAGPEYDLSRRRPPSRLDAQVRERRSA